MLQAVLTTQLPADAALHALSMYYNHLTLAEAAGFTLASELRSLCVRSLVEGDVDGELDVFGRLLQHASPALSSLTLSCDPWEPLVAGQVGEPVGRSPPPSIVALPGLKHLTLSCLYLDELPAGPFLTGEAPDAAFWSGRQSAGIVWHELPIACTWRGALLPMWCRHCHCHCHCCCTQGWRSWTLAAATLRACPPP